MKVFLTGNYGYVGTVLENLLEKENFEIVGCDIGYFPKSLVNSQDYVDKKNYLKKDIRNVTSEDLEGVDAICHLAGLSNDPMGEINEELTYTINYKTTIALAKTAKKAGVKRFIFSSSCSSYGANQDVMDEKSDVSPLTAYAKSKVLAENDLLELKDDEFFPVNLRSATAYGLSPNLRLDLVANNLTGSAVTTGLVKMLSDGSASRPLVHVEDMSQAFVQVLKSSEEKIKGEVFNVGSNENNFIVKEIAEIVESIVPNSKISFGDNVSKDSRSYKVNFDKISNELNFKPKRKLTEGIEEMYRKFIDMDINEKEFLDKNFYRLKYLKWLIQERKVNSNLEMK
jgi:nucleoside-diphosphate-sugar epimerase